MTAPHEIEKAIGRVHDQASFLQDLLGRTLGWPVEHGIERVEDIAEIITSGPSLAEAFANACEALDLHLESLQKLGLPCPESRHQLAVQDS